MKDPRDYRHIAFDLDGTLRECTVPGQHCPNRDGEQRVIRGVAAFLAMINWRNTYLSVITNQGGVALGYLTEITAMRLAWDAIGDAFGDSDAYLARLFMCTHAPKSECECRKPKPYFLRRAMECHGLLWEPSFASHTLYVGDQESDRAFAENAGCDFAWAHAGDTPFFPYDMTGLPYRLPPGTHCEGGCSPGKVKVGLCDTYDANGVIRPHVTRHKRA